jgi:hypothetical protein
MGEDVIRKIRAAVEELPVTDLDGDDLIDLHDVLAILGSADPVSPPSPPTDICWCRKNPCVCQPEHDAACESELTSHGYTPCRCNWRRAMSAASPSVPPAVSPPSPDPEIQQLFTDHARALEFVREIATWEDCVIDCGQCIVCRAKAWLHTPAASPSVPVERTT